MHIRRLTSQLRLHLHREADTQLFTSIMDRNQQSEYAKTALLATFLHCPGIPLSMILGQISSQFHRNCLVGLFSGDFFLARYAGNYFAREFIPTTMVQKRRAEELGIQPSRVCLFCWHNSRRVCFEDESHVLLSCPRYSRERASLWNELEPSTFHSRGSKISSGSHCCSPRSSPMQSSTGLGGNR